MPNDMSGDPGELDRLLAPLQEQEREVMLLRFGLDRGEPRTLDEVAERLGLTRAHVEAVEEAAIERLTPPG